MPLFGMYAAAGAGQASQGLQDVRRHHKTMSAPPSGKSKAELETRNLDETCCGGAMNMSARLSLVLLAGSLLPVGARAQLVQEFSPPKADCCLQFLAQRLAEQLQDWNQLGRYHEDDRRLEGQSREKGRVVFLGDSITDGWKLGQYFPGKPYVNRGISGQTTPQMLVRMFPDVINLQPEALIILAGTNDIARNTGPETAEIIEDNFRAICELAARHGIKPIIGLLLPVSDYTPRK